MRLGQFIVTPESRSALLAVRRLAKLVQAGRSPRGSSPLFLHGPPGVGKSHLASGLLAAVSESTPPRTARLVAASEPVTFQSDQNETSAWHDYAACDLLIVEDLQHLHTRSAAAFRRLADERIARGLPVLITANVGPAQLHELPPRLTNLLSSGLVIGLERPTPATRRYLLERFAQRQRLLAAPEVLDWLSAQTTGGVRPIQGAITTLAALSAGSAQALDLATVQRRWMDATPLRPTSSVQRILQQVAHYYSLDSQDLKSRSRQSSTLWPLQVAMFLVRERTGLPWNHIGDQIGGRDPSTVRHAVRKVTEKAARDPATAAVLRQLTAAVA